MGRIENILKVLMSDHSNAPNYISNYRNLIPDGDFDTFKKVKFLILGILPLRPFSDFGHEKFGSRRESVADRCLQRNHRK